MSIQRNRIVYSQWTFWDKDIQDCSVYLTTSLLSDALEANTLSATVTCADKAILDFVRNAPLTYYHRERQVGIFYVQSITRIGPTAYTLEATSAIGLMIEGLHYGGIYAGETLAELVADICGSIPYVVKSDLQDIALYGWLPVASPRDNLAQVLFAVGASIRTDLNGVLHIETLWDEVSRTLPANRMYRGPSVDYGAKVTQVIVTEHGYSEGGEETSLFEGTTQANDIIVFDEPMYSLQAEGFSILESGANYARVSAGAGTLTGRKYIHRTRQVSASVSESNEPNVKTVTDATLVSVTNAAAVAQRLAAYYACVETLNTDAVYQGELPGEVAEVWHPYDQQTVQACIQSAEISMSNTLKAAETLLIGYRPVNNEEAVILSHKVILTGSGSWTPPEGTTYVHAVLIGGGGKGHNGAAGGSTVSPGDTQQHTGTERVPGTTPPTTVTVESSSSASSPAVSAAEGGEGGEPGVPGYILEADLDVVPGQAIAYVCGAAGQTPGQTGGATTFGGLSSASGGLLPGGYVDVTTGTTYAQTGEAGVAGANGGSSGNAGGSVAGVSGGAGLAGDSDSGQSSGPSEYEDYTIDGNFTANWNCNAMGGGGAGGGTADNLGSPGQNAVKTEAGSVIFPAPGTDVFCASEAAQVHAGPGGAGANGKSATTYGSAGSGGHGGGGAGAIGARTAQASSTFTATFYTQAVKPDTISLTTLAETYEAAAQGGAGGIGGNGMPGCIIVFYGVAETIAEGAAVDKDGKFLVDNYARYLVV